MLSSSSDQEQPLQHQHQQNVARKAPSPLIPSPPKVRPILIIPGFMSSGLEVHESKLRPSWQGKRIWLNLSSLGSSAMYFGKAQRKNTNQKKKLMTTSTTKNHRRPTYSVPTKHDENEVEGEEEERHRKFKSAWMEHMLLNQTNMREEVQGVKIRPIQGLEGVDYLTPGAITSMLSYVFGPVIVALKRKAGYIENVNLQAATYDWRLPPMYLQLRDGFFSRTAEQVEDMYYLNHETQIVLLGHSLGCKTAHYFMNYCLQHKGQEWLDRYIYSYVPVGAPHLGAPKALRSYIAGDKMGLEAFLNDEEALTLGRALGSGPWMFPAKLPTGVPPCVHVLPHGVLQVSIDYAINVHDLVRLRHPPSKPNQYQLLVSLFGQHTKLNDTGKRYVKTGFRRSTTQLEEGGERVGVGGQAGDTVYFPDQISFTTNPVPNSSEERFLQIFLQEPGLSTAKMDRREEEKSNNPLVRCLKFVCCCCCVCTMIYKIIHCLFCGLFKTVALGADAIVTTVGASSANLAFSEPISIPKEVWVGGSTPIKMTIPLYHKDDYEKQVGFLCFKQKKQPRQTFINISLKWIPYNEEKSFRAICSHIAHPSNRGSSLRLRSNKRQHYQHHHRYENNNNSKNTSPPQQIEYQEFPGYDLMEREGLLDTLHMIKEVYDKDVLRPRSVSSSQAPPVKRIHAIYGVNLPTEIGAVYQRKDTCLSDDRLKNLYTLDQKASLEEEKKKGSDDNEDDQNNIDNDTNNGYIVKGGLIFETSNTKQNVTTTGNNNDGSAGDSSSSTTIERKKKKICGDGTVPYWSLQHCKTWQDDQHDVSVVELDKAEHREILADTRFHDAIIEYCQM